MTPIRFNIIYKAKPILTDDGVCYKVLKKVSKTSHTDLTPSTHPCFNSDIMDSIIARALKSVVGYRGVLWANDLPEGVRVDATGFLHTITISVEG